MFVLDPIGAKAYHTWALLKWECMPRSRPTQETNM